MRSRRIERVLGVVLAFALAWPGADAMARRASAPDPPPALTAIRASLSEHVETHTPPGGARVSLRFFHQPASTARLDRLVETTQQAFDLFTDWLGPFQGDTLTVIDAPWQSGFAGAAYAGTVVTSLRWITPDRDASMERALVGAMARVFWPAAAAGDDWFNEGVRLFLGARGVNAQLDGRNFATPRFFGCFVPLPLRSVPLSFPPGDVRAWSRRVSEVVEPASAPWRSSSASADGAAARTAAAVHTLERFIGWPALQQALATLRERSAGAAPSLDQFAAIVAEQRGTDAAWFFGEAFRPGVRFDYGVEALSTVPGERPGMFTTVVTLRRHGDGVFSGSSAPRSDAFGDSRALAVEVWYEDGRRVREGWDGRAERIELAYESPTPAVAAIVDADHVLQLDADRANNARTMAPAFHETGARLAAHWLIWLQHLMLATSALV